jgi:hypothetical protein
MKDSPQKNKPIVVRNALSAEACKVIERYCLIREKREEIYGNDGLSHVGDHFVGAYAVYADPMSESLMLLLMPKIESAIGARLFPTYSFYRVYRNGQSLPRHWDRESCEISASIFLAKGYVGKEWPLFIDGEEISLDVGDMVVYRGADLEHWREEFGLDGYHIQAFVHYVDRDGEYADWKLDKRKSIFHKDREGG